MREAGLSHVLLIKAVPDSDLEAGRLRSRWARIRKAPHLDLRSCITSCHLHHCKSCFPKPD